MPLPCPIELGERMINVTQQIGSLTHQVCLFPDQFFFSLFGKLQGDQIIGHAVICRGQDQQNRSVDLLRVYTSQAAAQFDRTLSLFNSAPVFSGCGQQPAPLGEEFDSCLEIHGLVQARVRRLQILCRPFPVAEGTPHVAAHDPKAHPAMDRLFRAFGNRPFESGQNLAQRASLRDHLIHILFLYLLPFRIENIHHRLHEFDQFRMGNTGWLKALQFPQNLPGFHRFGEQGKKMDEVKAFLPPEVAHFIPNLEKRWVNPEDPGTITLVSSGDVQAAGTDDQPYIAQFVQGISHSLFVLVGEGRNILDLAYPPPDRQHLEHGCLATVEQAVDHVLVHGSEIIDRALDYFDQIGQVPVAETVVQKDQQARVAVGQTVQSLDARCQATQTFQHPLPLIPLRAFPDERRRLSQRLKSDRIGKMLEEFSRKGLASFRRLQGGGHDQKVRRG